MKCYAGVTSVFLILQFDISFVSNKARRLVRERERERVDLNEWKTGEFETILVVQLPG